MSLRHFLKLAVVLGSASYSQGFSHSSIGKAVGNHDRLRKTTQLESTPFEESPRESLPTRRQTIELAVGALGLGTSFAASRENKPTDYGLWGILPIGPYKTKKTIMETIVPDKIWTMDQKFGILNVQVPIRMTVVKLSSGGLFVYDPIAATPECVSFVRELEKVHGKVKHIVLGSVAIEHKQYASVFAQKFSEATVWLQKGQYSFPNDLPPSFLGFPSARTKFIPENKNDAPSDWTNDFNFETLGPIISRDGAFGETVFFHKETNTLLCTDTVVEVTEDVPKIFETDTRPLLYHARDTMVEVVEDTEEVRKRGWRRVVLFGLFFNPAAIVIKDGNEAYSNRRPDINPDFAGIYPFDWVGDDISSFKALQGGLLVAPILQKLILNRYPVETLDFADKVAKWPIQRIIPAHLKNDLKYSGADYRKAFSFLEASGVPAGLPNPLASDFKTLADAEINLMESGAIVKCPPLVGGKIDRAGILAQEVYQCRSGVCTPKAEI